MKKCFRSRVLLWLLLASVHAVMFNIGFDLCCYRNYEDKMFVLEQMAQDGSASGLDRAAYGIICPMLRRCRKKAKQTGSVTS